MVENNQETRVTAADFACGNAEAARALVTQAKACIAPAVQFFRTKFNTQGTPMFEMLQLFKAVQILCPQQARAIGLTAVHIRALTIVPGLGDGVTIDSLLDELPAYNVAATDAPIDEDCPRLMWWSNQVGLPTWKFVTRIVFALHPSSAAAERVFSLMEAAISSRQANLLGEQLEALLMLPYKRSHIASL